MIDYEPSPELIAVEALVKAGADPDGLADALNEYLPVLFATEDPSATIKLRLEEVARLMKIRASKPPPPEAIARLRAWPAARLTELTAVISALHAEIQAGEIEKMNDAIGREISRAYS
jgi:hypothetical protein